MRWWWQAGLAAALAATPVQAKSPKVGEPAPDFAVKLVNGQRLRLADLKGQVVVLNFWATWCGPCRTELPLLDGFYKAMKPYGLRVLAITTEDSVPEFRMKTSSPPSRWEPIHGIKGPYAPIDDGVPTSFIIDRAGTLRYAKAGALTLDTLNAQLVPLLREPAPSGH